MDFPDTFASRAPRQSPFTPLGNHALTYSLRLCVDRFFPVLELVLSCVRYVEHESRIVSIPEELPWPVVPSSGEK